jgi:hypothetical protein
LFDKDKNYEKKDILERNKIELVAQKITWIFILLVLINEFNCTRNGLRIDYVKPYFGSLAFVAIFVMVILNGIKGYFIRKFLNKNYNYDKNNWYICRIIDMLIISIIAVFFDKNGEFIFLVLLLTLFITFDEEYKEAFNIMALADALYCLIIGLGAYITDKGFSNNIKEFLIKLIILL